MSFFHFPGFHWLLYWGGIGVLTLLASVFGGKERKNYLRIIAGCTLLNLVCLTALYHTDKTNEWEFVGMLVVFCLFMVIANAMKRSNLSFPETIKLFCRPLVRDKRQVVQGPEPYAMPSASDKTVANSLSIAYVEPRSLTPGQKSEIETQHHSLYWFWGGCSQGRFIRFWTLFAEALLKSRNLTALVADNTTARNILANIASAYENNCNDQHTFYSLSAEARRAADLFPQDSRARHAMLAASAAAYVAPCALGDWGHRKATEACREAVLAVGNVAFADALMAELTGLEAVIGPSHPSRVRQSVA